MRAFLALFAFVALAAAAHPNEIIDLPGAPPHSFKMFSGYVHPSPDRHLFYWYVEAASNKDAAPLVLWLNGGPGCSSLEGLLSETGPFYPDKADNGTKRLLHNPSSWNQLANMLYLEAPAGVGFSYYTNPDYSTGDVQTAQDNYEALLQFFVLYPELQGRDFFITGESYAGHYIPQLAQEILNGNQMGNSPINLKGFAAGNPLTNLEIDGFGTNFAQFSHALISPPTYANITASCTGDFVLYPSPECNGAMEQATLEMGDIDPYAIYTPVCHDGGFGLRSTFLEAMAKHSPIHRALYANYKPIGRNPCIEAMLGNYLNQPDVKAAIHAETNLTWVECANVNYNQTDLNFDIIPLYENFIKNYNLRIYVYSGDVDTVVPYAGTNIWVYGLGLPQVTPWHPWYVNEQVAGYAVEFDGLTFLTVKDAGHMVPEFQPVSALFFITTFLNGGHL